MQIPKEHSLHPSGSLTQGLGSTHFWEAPTRQHTQLARPKCVKEEEDAQFYA